MLIQNYGLQGGGGHPVPTDGLKRRWTCPKTYGKSQPQTEAILFRLIAQPECLLFCSKVQSGHSKEGQLQNRANIRFCLGSSWNAGWSQSERLGGAQKHIYLYSDLKSTTQKFHAVRRTLTSFILTPTS
jgi:hypothetical protein